MSVRRSMRDLNWAFLIGFRAGVLPASADEPCRAAVGDRPSIGLVLGGGGARGSAHIGVIRKLDEPPGPTMRASMSVPGIFAGSGMHQRFILRIGNVFGQSTIGR